MQILRIDHKEGILRLALQSLEDVWHLYKVLEEGDQVRAKTYRKVSIKRGSQVLEGDKKPVNLTIRLEKAEFHLYTGKLRLSGEITSGPEDIQLASHHTIQVEPGMQVTVQKEKIKSYQLERLQRAKVPEARLFLVAIDREQADFGELREFGLQQLGSVRFRKREPVEDERGPFYREILKTLEGKGREGYGKIIVCGPGFERENFFSFVKKESPVLAEKILLEHASEVGKPGMQEVIKTSASRILKETRIARETEAVEKLLLGLKKGELAVHGRGAVEKAAEYGALDTLLVSDHKIREFEPLLDKAEKTSAKISIISSEHQAGEQLLALGGIAGLLRFRL